MKIETQPVYKKKQPRGRAPKFTAEYYMMMVKHIVEDDLSYRKAARAYNVSHGTIAHWMNLYKDGKLPARMKKAGAQAESQECRILRMENYIDSLKTEIGELYLENQMLKKAQVYKQQLKNASSSAITSENLAQWKKAVK
jgi:transposase-like protein